MFKIDCHEQPASYLLSQKSKGGGALAEGHPRDGEGGLRVESPKDIGSATGDFAWPHCPLLLPAQLCWGWCSHRRQSRAASGELLWGSSGSSGHQGRGRGAVGSWMRTMLGRLQTSLWMHFMCSQMPHTPRTSSHLTGGFSSPHCALQSPRGPSSE